MTSHPVTYINEGAPSTVATVTMELVYNCLSCCLGNSSPEFHPAGQMCGGRGKPFRGPAPSPPPQQRKALLSQEPLRESLDILASVEYSRCELQPRPSRIPVGSQTPSLRVWKLITPGIKKHLAGVSGKDTKGSSVCLKTSSCSGQSSGDSHTHRSLPT